MNDKQFETLIMDSMPDLPPENIAKNITPWKIFIYYILIGLILNTITISFWNLQYILPFIGNFFILFGFRVLKKENHWFYYGYIFSWICMLASLPALILNTTLYSSLYASTGLLKPFLMVIGIAKLFCFYGLYRCLVFAFREIQEKCGMKPQLFTGNLILGWCMVICFLDIFRYSGTIISLILLIAYGFIIYGIYTMTKELEHIGYSIQIAPVHISGLKIVITMLSILLLCGLVGYSFFDSYPMEWTEKIDTPGEEILLIKEDLIEKGFPKDVLDDLTQEDLLECKDAKRIITDTISYKNYDDIPKEYVPYGIAVELASKTNHYKIIHYFKWENDAKFYGTEAIAIWTVDSGNVGYWTSNNDYSGQLLYDQGDNIWHAPYYSLRQVNAEYPDRNMG